MNAASPEDFCAALEGVVERAPWVVAAAAAQRPFADLASLHGALVAALLAAPEEAQRAFLNAHEPLVAGPLPTTLTEASRREQGDTPLGALVTPEALAAQNAAYRDRFGFPFILCLRRHSSANVLRCLATRLAAPVEAELAVALTEIGHVIRLRLRDRIEGPPPAMLGVALDRPATVRLQLEDTTLFDGALPAGRHPLAPLRMGRWRLWADGAPTEIWPENAEAEILAQPGLRAETTR
ncbi:2-oxo-4-hydroxy-4-carboxy-5-ureidoimidazoline decarboxylase [Roseomonas sp. 18066]|uniref:2-oxo-4-hydroxy-4-carboxy-5-ureidoimidazoline decarboxylase n=1 Tax=Roseomonas sp. 18066 TaxID=2681412 RepID=UPI00190F678C|nr:2-oxo-4-hydroxy-4-carboxy-5-ureidoimidazoline decarboxylase [Roseomonas sp. 18066]